MMAICEELTCGNVQSAICLHCLHRLCSIHIAVHLTVLRKESDDLGEHINGVAKQLDVSFQQIRTAREEATSKLNIWRQNQIDKIEQKYAEKMQVVGFRKHHLAEREEELTQRLVKEAKEPLEHMQAEQSTSSENLQTIRQAIAHITHDSVQLELNLKSSSTQSASTNTNVIDKRHPMQSNRSQQQQASGMPQYYMDPLMNSTSVQAVIHMQNPHAPTGSFPMVSNYFSNPTVPISTMTSSSPTSVRSALPPKTLTRILSARSRQSSTASLTSPVTIKLPPTHSSRRLIKYFQNISGTDDQNLERYIIHDLNKLAHVNNVMILLLSLFHAWHSAKLPSVFHPEVLLYHINTIKKYIKEQEYQLTIIEAIEVFIDSCNHPENKSSSMFTELLELFLNHQCITKETVLTWYRNGISHVHNDFEKSKLWAQSFVDQLNANVESTQT